MGRRYWLWGALCDSCDVPFRHSEKLSVNLLHVHCCYSDLEFIDCSFNEAPLPSPYRTHSHEPSVLWQVSEAKQDIISSPASFKWCTLGILIVRFVYWIIFI